MQGAAAEPPSRVLAAALERPDSPSRPRHYAPIAKRNRFKPRARLTHLWRCAWVWKATLCYESKSTRKAMSQRRKSPRVEARDLTRRQSKPSNSPASSRRRRTDKMSPQSLVIFIGSDYRDEREENSDG